MKGWEHEEDKDKHEDELDRKNALKLPFVNSSTCPNCYDEGLGEYDQEEMARFGMSDTNPYVMVFSCGSCDFSAIDEWQPHRHGLPDWFFQNTVRIKSDIYCWSEVADMSVELERFKEQVKKLKEEIEYLKKQKNWEHEVLMYMEDEDFSYDGFLYYVDNAGWCNECDSVSVNEQHLQGGRTLENPNADGEYECYYCWQKNEDEKV